MVRKIGLVGGLMGLALLLCSNLIAVEAQGPPDFTKYGYPTVAKSMDLTPDQAATITAGDQSVAIKAGTFDSPVTFDLLTSEPSAWKDLVKDRTVRAAFAFRVTDKATKAIVGAFKQPVTYSYAGKDAQSTDVILNTTAASPPVITVNGTPPTFDGKVNHGFGGAGVGWLVASATTSGAAGTPAAAAGTPVAQASPSATAAGTAGPSATAASTAAPSATAAATAAPTATRPAATAVPVATGTGGGAAPTSAPTTLPKTGEARATGARSLPLIVLGGGAVLLIAGIALVMRRRAGVVRD